MFNVDENYVIGIRRELHKYPEIGYDNPKTLALIRRELDAMGIEHTGKFGKGSIVGTINSHIDSFTIGLRADTDAIYVTEINDVDYKSLYEGQMHACGHDAHTAMLLGAAKTLSAMKENLECRVKLLFQCCEEGPDTGARHMVTDGVMDDIDVIIAQHVSPDIKSGEVGICPGISMAACHPFFLRFYGTASHITVPQAGKCALSMAVKTYIGIQNMRAEIDPFASYICGIGALRAGKTFGIVADYAEIEGVLTTYDLQLDKLIMDRMIQMGKNSAEEVGGRFEAEHEITCLIVDNDLAVSDLIIESANKVAMGTSKVDPILGCEDFSFFISKKPGALFWIGVRNEEIGAVNALHTSDFTIDEEALGVGCKVFVQFVLDNMNGCKISNAKR